MPEHEAKILLGVNALMLNEKDQVLMGVRKNAFSAGELSIPSGHIEVGETIQQAVVREIAEETGVTVEEQALILMAITNYIIPEWEHQYISFDFLVKKWEGNVQAMEPDKCEAWQWMNLEDIPAKIHYPAEKTITHYKQWKMTGQTIVD